MPHRQSELRLVAPEGNQHAPTLHEHMIAMAHEARQKMCANMLNAQMIADHLSKPRPDAAAIATLLDRIVGASRLADLRLADIQALALGHPIATDRRIESLRYPREAAFGSSHASGRRHGC